MPIAFVDEHKYIRNRSRSLAHAPTNTPKGLAITLILDRYRIVGRAGAGGYATVQHAYDTRLKRDVAIKCIKITKRDKERGRISIHDAQIENATRAL